MIIKQYPKNVYIPIISQLILTVSLIIYGVVVASTIWLIMAIVAYAVFSIIPLLLVWNIHVNNKKFFQDELEDIKQEVATLQEQLITSERLAALGKITAGVAHDFGNLMQVIRSGIDYLNETSQYPNNVQLVLKDIEDANKQALLISRQLRSYYGPKRNNNIEVNTVIEQMCNMISRAFGTGIDLSLDLYELPLNTKCDLGSFEQVILNIAVNARDAVEDNGLVTVSTFVCDLVEKHEVKPKRQPDGNYICIVISDNGCGISEEFIGQIFEPFYTTKDPEKGTGLGLATSRRIIKESGGEIFVSSLLGIGTSFFIYLPLVEESSHIVMDRKTISK